jgi:hypothetical protein
MYKVHAHKEGYSEVMSRVSRDNDGYMPILKLQKAIKLISVDKNRQKSYSNFEAGKNQMARPNAPQVNSVASTPGGKLDCCYKFLEGKCQKTNCKHPHLNVAVPAGVCGKYLHDKSSCTGSCGKLHDRWSVVIRKLNDASPAKASKPKQRKQSVAPPSQPTDEQGSDSDSDGGGQGNHASEKSGSHPCTRCGKAGHEHASCYSSTHSDGSWLTCPKPCPVPADFWDVDQTWEASDGENQKGINTLHARVFTPDQYMDNGIVLEEEVYWPTHQVTVLCSGSNADYDAQDALSLPLEPDSLVIATEGSKICQ